MAWVGLGWVGLGRDFSVFGGLGRAGLGPLLRKVLKFVRIMLMHLKRGYIRFGCTKQLNLLDVLGWVGLGWVSQLMGWVRSGHTKWTRGQLWGSNDAA